MTAARSREHDEWIPWYVEDTPGWLELSLAARGAMEGVARKLNRRTGQLPLRRGLSGLAVLLHVRWDELEPALAELIAKGKVTWDAEQGILSDPDYVERKRRTGAERMAEHRARKRVVTDVTSPVSLPSPVTPVTDGDGSDGCSSLVSSDLISDLGSEIARAPGERPSWFDQAIEVVAMNTGVTLAPGEAWLRYDGHRAGKGLAPNTRDAQYWLATVMVPEQRETLRRAARDKDRDAKFDRDRRGGARDPEKPAGPTKAQAEAFARELAARVSAQRAGGGQ